MQIVFKRSVFMLLKLSIMFVFVFLNSMHKSLRRWHSARELLCT